MIAGLFITYFKTYSKLNFIPLSDEHNLCGILGKNGIGKSSVLEALDYFFNQDEGWNLHLNAKKKGISDREGAATPYMCPIFVIDNNEKIKPAIKDVLFQLDNLFRNSTKDNVDWVSVAGKDTFFRFKENLCENFPTSSYLIIPIGITYSNKITLSIFQQSAEHVDILNNENLNNVLEYIRDVFDYVYIPKDIDSEQFTKLETKEIQVLMGESLEEIIKGKITDSNIRDINAKLDEFINGLENDLNGYVYKTIQRRQSKVKRADVYNLILETYFSVRKLHKKLKDEQFIEINQMSSGEKQKAIIDVAHSLLKNHRTDGSNLILGIDEPEASLHISACFEQFNSLFDIGNDCRQVIFTSHWYGYLPILNNGNTCVITKDNSSHRFDLINTNNYQEDLHHRIKDSKGKMPYDIQLKSTTDFIQSILINIFSENPYNWILCEGTSEKIYFERYFKEEVISGKLRIVPVGGAKKIKKIYQNIIIPYKEMKEWSIKSKKYGKILLLSDTDRELVRYDVISDDENFKCQRIVNSNDKTEMVNMHSNPSSPETEIEDCLNGKLFVETLKLFIDEFPNISSFIDLDKNYEESISSYSLNLRDSERKELKKIFDSDNGKFKEKFARKYCSLLEDDSYKKLDWIENIRNWFAS